MQGRGNFLPNVNSKLPQVGTTVFTVMSRMAQEYGATNLSQGFPDFSCHHKLVDLVHHYMKKGFNQYAPMHGIPILRERIAQKVKELYGANADPEESINVTSGATEAIYAAITATVREGDEVIVLEPAYDCYVPAIQLNGGVPIFVQLDEQDYSINWDALTNRINHNTRMIIINSPHNPTGAILTEEDMEQLVRLTHNTDILILSDEVYEHIIFNEAKHQSVLRYPELYNRSFAVFSFGKTYHNTGWKMGYCIAPEYLMREFRKVHQYLVFSSPTPFQYAFADFLEDKSAYLELSSFYQQKRDHFDQLMAESPFEMKPTSGTYFQLASYANISDQRDTAFAEWLTKEVGVAAIPLSPFYSRKTDNKVLRFCFAKSEAVLEEAVAKLRQVKSH